MLGLSFVACTLLGAVFFLVGLGGLLEKQTPNPCLMTYMWPSYHLVPNSPVDAKGHGYSLYLYREAIPQAPPKLKVSGVPVLFIPGNAGFYAQVRSIGSVTTHIQLRKRAKELDFFAINFNEELSGFSGTLLQDQIRYANDCIRHILSLYGGGRSSVVVVGHSMGGFVAMALEASDNFLPHSVDLIITLAGALRHAPVYLDFTLYQLYQNVTSEFTSKSNITLISIAGGVADTLVRSDLGYLSSATTETRKQEQQNSRHLVMSSAPQLARVWLSPDHLCILWCNQLVVQVSEFLSAFAELPRSGLDKDALLSKYFDPGLGPSAVTAPASAEVIPPAFTSLTNVTVPAWAKTVIVSSKQHAFSVKPSSSSSSDFLCAPLPNGGCLVHATVPVDCSSLVVRTAVKNAQFTMQFLNVTLENFPSSVTCCTLSFSSFPKGENGETIYCAPPSVSASRSLSDVLWGTNVAQFTVGMNHPIVSSFPLRQPQLQQHPISVRVSNFTCPGAASAVLHVQSGDEQLFFNLSSPESRSRAQFFSSHQGGSIVTVIADQRCSFSVVADYDRMGGVIHSVRMFLPLLPAATLAVALGVLAQHAPMTSPKFSVVGLLVCLSGLCLAGVPSLFTHFHWADRGEGSSVSVLFVASLLLCALPCYAVGFVASVMLTGVGQRVSRVLGSARAIAVVCLLLLALLLGFVHFGAATLLLLLLLCWSFDPFTRFMLPALILANPPALASLVVSANLLTHGVFVPNGLFSNSVDTALGFLALWIIVALLTLSSPSVAYVRPVALMGAMSCVCFPFLPFLAHYWTVLLATAVVCGAIQPKPKRL